MIPAVQAEINGKKIKWQWWSQGSLYTSGMALTESDSWFATIWYISHYTNKRFFAYLCKVCGTEPVNVDIRVQLQKCHPYTEMSHTAISFLQFPVTAQRKRPASLLVVSARTALSRGKPWPHQKGRRHVLCCLSAEMWRTCTTFYSLVPRTREKRIYFVTPYVVLADSPNVFIPSNFRTNLPG